ncbi:MAG: polysaccharide biosynthesis tyrosine autokinase [Goleter apudmare HA4340-LM2]|jgi:capsular exopolysaccharide synthesis family protein|nr:polysaccharide biosynthesis tyrosine autokinase [Goleter apudmare HA4340-LM2]
MGKDISSLLKVLKRRGLPTVTTFASVIGGSVAYTTVTPRLYETSGRLMLDEKQVSVSQLGRDLSQLPSVTPGGPNPIATQAELIKSQRVLQRALTRLPALSPPETIDTKELSKALKVKIVPATNILELNYQHQNPAVAAKILNAVLETMVAESTESIRSEARSVRKFLTDQVPKAQSRLRLAEAAENSYRQKTGLISFEEQSKSLVASLATLENQERVLFTELQEARSRDASLQKITKGATLPEAYASVRSGQDEELKKLRAKLAELEAKLIETRLQFTDNHPTVVSLLQQRNDLRALYQSELSRVAPENQAIASNQIATDEISQTLTSQLITGGIERSALEKKLQAIQSERAKLQFRLSQLPIQQQPLTALVRQREEAADSLKLLQSKLEEARIAEAQLVSNVRVIEKAEVPKSPSFPNQLAVLVVASAFSAFLAVCVVLLLELADNTVRDASEVEAQLKLPLLGILPQLSPTPSLHQPEQFLNNLVAFEAYRMLFKTLEFRRQEQLGLVVVTSALSGEGKSVVAAHLAATSAMLSRRTLIIDADLRTPSQHSLFNVSPYPGITDVISSELSLLRAAQPTNIKNLSVLSCGELADSPAILIESPSMQKLLLEAEKYYDLVIIDTPAINNYADASTLGKYAEGLVMVTRPNFTSREALNQAVTELTRNQIPILGFVANGAIADTRKSDRPKNEGEQPLLQPHKHFTPRGGLLQDADK